MSTTLASDGKQFVYAVFGADGCECDSLEAVFGDQESAVAFANDLRDTYDEYHHTFYGKPEFLTVRQIEVGKKIYALEPNVVWAGEASK